MPQKIIFATQRYQYLKDRILALAPDWEDGKLEIRDFPDGEHYHRIRSQVHGKEVIVLGGTIDDKETLELFDIAHGCIQLDALALNLVIPFFGYSTMERAVKSGEIVKAKTRALLFSALPATNSGNKVILMDLHVDGITYYFESGVRPVHLYGKDLVKEAAMELGEGETFVLASTDAGRAKWVESLANDLNVEAAFVFKKRISGETTQITGINAEVENKNVIIYDDMIRTGGSLIHAAQSYLDAGAKSISVITTHGIFAGGGFEKIKKSGIIKKVICADTHPNALSIQDALLTVKSVDKIIVDYFLQHG
ncbi:ribose-phosphate diphosphokinase [Chitinophaga sancti]|uniref:ribose-phosphate diphosphokinase n=1 Tax=Chitinophaga sancti TaxID=1004 RepID=A0A1K1NR26_9BACT|nr:ribose-phosphate diphosphokinase [Chitinophaga sancti]WQD60118.1 ribose-phosphate diphosphokinase [Chitinophaga sancti]WQG87754.1 ribose-phosphate diphosphokinase [Chitinophaga sancti]SFW37737.1 ribose-phosphate pyrophosphokinase [Chitinophaga sancti]